MFQRPASNRSSFADLQCLEVPTKVVVANLDSLDSLVGSWKELFSNEGALQPYEHAEACVGNIVFDMAKRREAHTSQRPMGP